MGQAHRRKQLDSTYGQFYQLASVDDLTRHFLLLWDGFFEQLAEETERRLSRRETVDFDEVSQRLANWLKPKMERYQPKDRETLAALIFDVYVSAPEDTLEERLGLKCLIEAKSAIPA